jgi:hypothetical protein
MKGGVSKQRFLGKAQFEREITGLYYCGLVQASERTACIHS